MPSLEKLIKKFLYKQDNINVGNVRGLLRDFDYKEYKSPGSHLVFRKTGKPPIIVATVKGRYIKKFYVKKIVHILNLEEYIEGLERD